MAASTAAPRGKNGTVEKNVTLAFAIELGTRLAATGKYNVFMTREKDEFLRLDDRCASPASTRPTF